MAKNLDLQGLRSVSEKYDIFFIDLWGVVHNGIKLNDDAVNTLHNLKKENKEFVLLTNAPRPNINVINFLKKLGLKDYFKNVYTSGEAALNCLISDYKNQKFFHIGPPRDFDLFKSFEKNKVKDIKFSDYLLCTGLFDDHDSDLIYYKHFLKDHVHKKMICTNPDLIVDRGEKREFCAGSVARSFEEINGEVIYFGKPYPPVYQMSCNLENKNVLCIGDNLNTDIRGANVQNFDSLLITSGIHRKEILNSKIEDIEKKYKVKINFIQSNLKW